MTPLMELNNGLSSTKQEYSDYFKLPAAQKPAQKQHPSASQPTPPTAQMFAVNHAALSETGTPAQKDAGRDPELEDLGLVSPGSMLNQSDAPPTWENFTQRLQDQKTDDTAISPGEKRKQANKENKPEPSKVSLKRKKSGLPEDVPDEGPEAAKKMKDLLQHLPQAPQSLTRFQQSLQLQQQRKKNRYMFSQVCRSYRYC
ncbi:TPA: hypothetical protein ACH3X1_014285 [Trebouxia sp. C0004]